MRSSQRSISKVIRVFQFGPQASASQHALTFDILAIAEVFDETFQVRLEARKRPAKPFELLFGIYRIVPTDMKDMSSPDHLSLTPLSYRSEIAPIAQKRSQLLAKPTTGDELILADVCSPVKRPRLELTGSSELTAVVCHQERSPLRGAVERRSGGTGLWQIRDIRRNQAPRRHLASDPCCPNRRARPIATLDNPLPLRFCQDFSACLEWVFSSRLMTAAVLSFGSCFIAVSQPRGPGKKIATVLGDPSARRPRVGGASLFDAWLPERVFPGHGQPCR